MPVISAFLAIICGLDIRKDCPLWQALNDGREEILQESHCYRFHGCIGVTDASLSYAIASRLLQSVELVPGCRVIRDSELIANNARGIRHDCPGVRSGESQRGLQTKTCGVGWPGDHDLVLKPRDFQHGRIL